MLYFLLIPAAVLGFLVFLPILITLIQVPIILSAKVIPAEGDDAEDIYEAALLRVAPAEVVRMGFQYEGSYIVNLQVSKPRFAMWRHGDDSTYLAVYEVVMAESTTWVTDIVSILSLNPTPAGLTTGTSKDVHTVPSPNGWWVQSFADSTVAALWEHHTRGEAHVAEQLGGMIEPASLSGAEALQWFLQYSMKYLVSHPWLLLLVPWQYWVGRHLRHNNPIRPGVR